MVAGLDKFKEHFAGFEDHYAIIGGAACHLLFDEAGLAFRATKDIDLVLCVEVVDAKFGQAFKSFLDAGGYRAQERSDGPKQFYRFQKPATAGYPHMIELFARKPELMALPETAHLTPIAAEQDVVSLSAILLDDAYFQAMQAAKKQIDGVTILDETLLIPFKARAFVDMAERVKNGEKVDSRNIKKHRNDVYRLLQLLPKDATVEISETIRSDLRRFLLEDAAQGVPDLKALGVAMKHDEALALLRSTYGLEEPAKA